jgi:hypothetical protein
MPTKHQFGNVFKGNKHDGAVAILIEDKGDYIMCLYKNSSASFMDGEKKEDLKLIGITPTNLAELAREKGENILWNDIIEEINIWAKNGHYYYPKKEKESLEKFCLRVAKLRGYLTK